MAVSSSLKRAARRIAGALAGFAAERGWKADDYTIYYRINNRWEKIHVIFAAAAFGGRGELECYSEVRDHVGKALADEPELLDLLGLVVTSPDRVKRGGIHSIGPEFREYKPRSPQ